MNWLATAVGTSRVELPFGIKVHGLAAVLAMPLVILLAATGLYILRMPLP